MIRLFRHYIPGSMMALGIAEALVLVLSIFLGARLRLIEPGSGSPELLQFLLLKALIFALVMLGAMTAMGLYWRDLRAGLWSVLFRVIGGFILGMVVLAVLFYLVPDVFIGRGALGLALLIALLGVLAARLAHHYLADHEAMKKRIVVVGTGKNAGQLETLRRKVDWHGFKLVGYVHVPGEHDMVDREKILDPASSLTELVDRHRADEIVVAIDDRRRAFPMDEILACKMKGVDIIDLVTFFERQTQKIKLDTLHPSSMIFSDGFSQAILKNFGKRVFDTLASLVLLLLVWPIMLATTIAILIESRGKGPILYRQERVGRNGVPFMVLKFRSMQVDAERDGGARWAEQGDPRTTRVGRFIRRSRIDELPQLLNVIRGQMSFVGPRPERPEFVAQLAREIPFYNLRHKVNPGITGWAQISYPYGSSSDDAVEKLQYDLYYIKNYSMLFDFMILFQTAYVVLWGKGAR